VPTTWSHQYQYTYILLYLTVYLLQQTQLDLENCVDIVTLAETYSLFQLQKRVYGFISAHLLEFSQTPEFERLSGDQLEYLLDSENPVDCSESDVLQILLQWTAAHPTRSARSTHLLSKVHYEVCLYSNNDYAVSIGT